MFELGMTGKKYTMQEINEKAKRRMNMKSETKLDVKAGPTENNFLEGLGKSSEKASGQRESNSFLDGLDTFDQKLSRIKQEEDHHRQEMKKLLGDNYKSPTEQFEDLKRETDFLKGL